MMGRRWIAVAAVTASLGAAAMESAAGDRGAPGSPPPTVCELRGADRARTSSLRCMACHDGGSAPMIAFQMSADGRGMSHPVEVDYAATAARHPERYHPPASLPRDVPLVRGRVACTSCHDGASPDPKRVAVVPLLCESCHRL
ncbi:MAG TPA: hypothetical protein VFL83_19960 [Anaeromyxobacter sp.]|nr:hypothetical protein [Anaeromyxobacter sp.]